ncbi:phosphotransferase [Streptomyces sp. NPDC058290]|uniref:phosphotransferase n=1 Tax=Streptomyces sp. NPDC058290 TaxID=3346426 RepID=UPI0036EE7EC8
MTRPDPVGLLDPATHAWLTRYALPSARLHEADPLPGGFTNDVALLTAQPADAPGAERYVLRRYRPSGSRVPRNTCAVEMAVLGRAAARTVPVTAVVAADPHGRATGRPTLLYRFVDGTPLSQPRRLPRRGPPRRLRAAQTAARPPGPAGRPRKGAAQDHRLPPPDRGVRCPSLTPRPPGAPRPPGTPGPPGRSGTGWPPSTNPPSC